MVDLIQVSSPEPTGVLNETYIVPDFSAFNKPVISWAITYGYESEPHLVIEFAGLPLYNNNPIEKAQLITIPLQGNLPINMYVRSIAYSLNAESVTTTLTLKTALIFFDQYLNLNIGTEKTAEAVFTGILTALHLPSGFASNNAVDWPSIADEVELHASETIIEWINSQLGKRKNKQGKEVKNPIFNWWFNIRNDLRVEPIFTESSQTFDLNLDTIRPIYISLDIVLADKWEKRSAPMPTNKSEPAEAATVPVAVAPINATSTDAVRLERRRVDSNTDNSVPEPSYQNFLVETHTVSLKLKGLHWLPEHEKLVLSNFQTGNGEYIIETISLTHSATGAFTTLDLKNFELAMPLKENDTDDDANKDKKPPVAVVPVGATSTSDITIQ